VKSLVAAQVATTHAADEDVQVDVTKDAVIKAATIKVADIVEVVVLEEVVTTLPTTATPHILKEDKVTTKVKASVEDTEHLKAVDVVITDEADEENDVTQHATAETLAEVDVTEVEAVHRQEVDVAALEVLPMLSTERILQQQSLNNPLPNPNKTSMITVSITNHTMFQICIMLPKKIKVIGLMISMKHTKTTNRMTKPVHTETTDRKLTPS
jgi:hypothetical protein